MHRRNFLILCGIGGLGLAAGGHYLFSQSSLTSVSCPKEVKKRFGKDNATRLPKGQCQRRSQQSLFNFLALGDTGTGKEEQYAVAKVMNCYQQANRVALVLLTGDNIYNRGEIQKISSVFERPYRPLLEQSIPFYATLGNHDVVTNNGEDEIKYSGFNMQGRYYTFIKESVQFFALDTNKNNHWQSQLNWLEDNLARSKAPWKVVFGHHPVYSSGMHGDTQYLTESLPPLFSRYKVQLYLNGHDHNYERTKLLQGTIYITCGAGAKLRPVEHSSRTAFSASKLSFVSFEVYPDIIEAQAIDSDGNVFDRMIIYHS